MVMTSSVRRAARPAAGLEKMDGTPATARDLPRETFSSQSDAESWLGESWRALLDAGVDQVTLLEEGRAEYGPMSLHPED
jgi:hypothetical protein